MRIRIKPLIKERHQIRSDADDDDEIEDWDEAFLGHKDKGDE
jgi:hypothetical protein